MRSRIESDFKGHETLPEGAYYGISTHRRLSQLPVSASASLARSLAAVKRSAAYVNSAAGLLPAAKMNAISRASSEMIAGKFASSVLASLSMPESFDMNVSEVIANRAIELRNGERGDYSIIHPREDVAMNQSPHFAFQIAARLSCLDILSSVMSGIQALQKRTSSFEQPFAESLSRNLSAVRKVSEDLKRFSFSLSEKSVHPFFREELVKKLKKDTGINIRVSDEEGGLVSLSSALMILASDVAAAGSAVSASLHPGSYAREAVDSSVSSCLEVISSHHSVVHAAEQSSMSRRARESFIASSVLSSAEKMANALHVMASADSSGHGDLEALEEQSAAFRPYLGHHAVSALGKHALSKGLSLGSAAVSKNILSRKDADMIMSLPKGKVDKALRKRVSRSRLKALSPKRSRRT